MSKVELRLTSLPKDKSQYSFHVRKASMKVFDTICKQKKLPRGKLLEKFVELVDQKKIVIK